MNILKRFKNDKLLHMLQFICVVGTLIIVSLLISVCALAFVIH